MTPSACTLRLHNDTTSSCENSAIEDIPNSNNRQTPYRTFLKLCLRFFHWVYLFTSMDPECYQTRRRERYRCHRQFRQWPLQIGCIRQKDKVPNDYVG